MLCKHPNGVKFVTRTIDCVSLRYNIWNFFIGVNVVITQPNNTTITSGDQQYTVDTTRRVVTVAVDGLAMVMMFLIQSCEDSSKMIKQSCES